MTYQFAQGVRDERGFRSFLSAKGEAERELAARAENDPTRALHLALANRYASLLAKKPLPAAFARDDEQVAPEAGPKKAR